MCGTQELERQGHKGRPDGRGKREWEGRGMCVPSD